MSNEEELSPLVIAIVTFLRDQLSSRFDLSLDDRNNLENAVEHIRTTFDLDDDDLVQTQPSRPLLDIYNQFAYPVSVKDKRQADNHKSQGNIFMSEQRYQEAAEEYTSAIDLDKWNAVYYCNRAGAFLKLEKYDDAITDCRQALSFSPDYAKAYSRMGQAYAFMNNPRRAIICFKQALELDPENSAYQQHLNTVEREAIDRMGHDFLHSILTSFFEHGEILINSDPSNDVTENDDTIQEYPGSTSDSHSSEPSSNGPDPSNDPTENDDHIRTSSGSPIATDSGESNSNYPYDSHIVTAADETNCTISEEKALHCCSRSKSNSLVFGYDNTLSCVIENSQICPSSSSEILPTQENELIEDSTKVIQMDSQVFGFSNSSLNNNCSSKEDNLENNANTCLDTNNKTEGGYKRYDESSNSNESTPMKCEDINSNKSNKISNKSGNREKDV